MPKQGKYNTKPTPRGKFTSKSRFSSRQHAAVIIFVAIFIGLGSWLVTRPKAYSAGELCANNGMGRCVEATSLSQSYLIMNQILAGGFQRMVEEPANICNGSNGVTPNCPFVIGYGLNNKMLGDTIFKFEFNSDKSKCLLGTYSSVSSFSRAIIGACGADGTYWVVDGHAALAYDNEIANVFSTNKHHSIEVLASGGANGAPVYVQPDGNEGGGFTSWGWQYR